VVLIDDLERQIDQINRRLRDAHADHPYIPLLMSAPGIGWVLAFTIAAEIGEIERFSSPEKLAGYTALCPKVRQSGDSDRRGRSPSMDRVTCAGPCSRQPCMPSSTRLLRALPTEQEAGLGKQRGAKVAQIDIARRLAHAIWHMLTRQQRFAPRGAGIRLAA
jgi:transposase